VIAYRIGDDLNFVLIEQPVFTQKLRCDVRTHRSMLAALFDFHARQTDVVE